MWRTHTGSPVHLSFAATADLAQFQVITHTDDVLECLIQIPRNVDVSNQLRNLSALYPEAILGTKCEILAIGLFIIVLRNLSDSKRAFIL